LRQLQRNLSPDAAKRVTFAGLVPHTDVPEYYANADIYINPSFYESFGMSIIEAMGAGLPVVATRVGAVPDLISHGQNGLLVDAASPLAIADAVGSLFANPGMALHRFRRPGNGFNQFSLRDHLLRAHTNYRDTL
jgi:glycosyltransferase involved in cell wall biosynthesis